MALSLTSLFAQNHDSTWYLGFGQFINRIVFQGGQPQITIDSSFTGRFYDNNSVFSDENGEYIAAFNGYRVYGADGNIMLNGDSIWYETEPYLFGYSDEDLPQGSLFLPWPDHPDSIALLYMSQGNAQWPDSLDLVCMDLSFALISKAGNENKGRVIHRRSVILNDTIQYGQLTAVKHANGRDWWLLINEARSNRYYSLLFDPSGFHLHGTQTVDSSIIYGFGQAAFSPDGNYFAVKNSVGAIGGNSIDIYHFDRCSGLLSGQFHQKSMGSSLGGLAFSPNSRFLYVSFVNQVYQYDLTAPNWDISKILVSDSATATKFHTMQLGPDNKIYVCLPSSSPYLHVIHQPDEPGLLCDVRPNDILLPKYNLESLSYSPFYRLGPNDGSPCDTLGLDNQASGNITPPKSLPDIILAPNPFGHSFTVFIPEGKDSFRFSLFNLMGQQIITTPVLTKTETFVLENQPAGIYWAILFDSLGNVILTTAMVKR